MIEPAKKDIGREVLYVHPYRRDRVARVGTITDFDLHCVYVRYGEHISVGNRRQDLEWVVDPSVQRAARI